MLTLIALSAVLMQEPPAPHVPPAPPEVRTRVMVMGPDGPGSMDKDGDGQVTRDEFAAPMHDHFARMDRNGDGRLTGEELAAGHGADHDMMRLRRPGGPGEHHVQLRRRGEAGGPETFIRGPHGPHLPSGEHGEHRIEIVELDGPEGRGSMDKDGDGRVSEAEFTAPMREAFARLDADRSGFIEEGERGHGRDVHVFSRRIETERGEAE